MKSLNGQGGFSIVELLVVIAVAAIMFVSVSSLINSQKVSTEFNQAVRKFQIDVDKVISNVSNGIYPSLGNFRCYVDTSLPQPRPAFSNVSSPQGTNKDCIYLGKVIHFGARVAGNPINSFSVYNIAGNRLNSNPLVQAEVEAKNIQEAIPTVIQTQTPLFNINEIGALEGGLIIYKILTRINSTTFLNDTNYAFGIFVNLASYQSDNRTIQTAPQLLDFYNVPNSVKTTALNSIAAYTLINDNMKLPIPNASPTYLKNPTVVICVQGRGANRKAALIIGNDGQRLKTSLHIGDIVTAVPAAVEGQSC